MSTRPNGQLPITVILYRYYCRARLWQGLHIGLGKRQCSLVSPVIKCLHVADEDVCLWAAEFRKTTLPVLFASEIWAFKSGSVNALDSALTMSWHKLQS